MLCNPCYARLWRARALDVLATLALGLAACPTPAEPTRKPAPTRPRLQCAPDPGALARALADRKAHRFERAVEQLATEYRRCPAPATGKRLVSLLARLTLAARRSGQLRRTALLVAVAARLEPDPRRHAASANARRAQRRRAPVRLQPRPLYRTGLRIAPDDLAAPHVALGPKTTWAALSLSTGAYLWHLPTGRLHCAMLHAKNNDTNGLTFSMDGKRLLVSSSKGVKSWSIATCEQPRLVTKLDLERMVTGANGTLVARTRFSEPSYLWIRTPKGKVIKRKRRIGVQKTRLRNGGTGEVEGRLGEGPLAISPRGRWIAVAVNDYFDKAPAIWLLDASSGRTRRKIRITQGSRIFAVAFDPRGRKVAAWHGHPYRGGGPSPSVTQWDVATGRKRASFRTPRTFPAGIKYLPSGRLIAVGRFGGLKIWDITGRKLLRSVPYCVGCERRYRGLWPVAFSKDGSRLMTSGTREAVILDPLTGRILSRALRVLPRIGAIETTPGDTLLVARDEHLGSWDLRSGRYQHRWRLKNRVTRLAPLLGGKAIATFEADKVVVRDASTGALRYAVAARPCRGSPQRVLHSDNRGALLAVTERHQVRIHDAATGRLRLRLAFRRCVDDLQVSPTGKEIAVAAGALHRYALPTGKLLWSHRLKGRHVVEELAYTADGRALVALVYISSDEQELRLIPLRRGGIRRRKLQNAHLTPVGQRLLAVLASQKNAQLLDVLRGKQLGSLGGGKLAGYRIKRRFAGGRGRKLLALATAAGTVRLWSTASRRLLASLLSEPQGGWVVLTPDGYVDYNKQGRALLHVLRGNRVYRTYPGWSDHHVPGLLRRLLRGDMSFRLTALRKLLRPSPKKRVPKR